MMFLLWDFMVRTLKVLRDDKKIREIFHSLCIDNWCAVFVVNMDVRQKTKQIQIVVKIVKSAKLLPAAFYVNVKRF